MALSAGRSGRPSWRSGNHCRRTARGKTTISCPLLGDQAFWGRVVYERGVGPRPIAQQQLSAEPLADAITTAITDPMLEREAADIGTKIRTEDGVAHAVAIISRIMGSLRRGVW